VHHKKVEKQENKQIKDLKKQNQWAQKSSRQWKFV